MISCVRALYQPISRARGIHPPLQTTLHTGMHPSPCNAGWFSTCITMRIWHEGAACHFWKPETMPSAFASGVSAPFEPPVSGSAPSSTRRCRPSSSTSWLSSPPPQPRRASPAPLPPNPAAFSAAAAQRLVRARAQTPRRKCPLACAIASSCPMQCSLKSTRLG